MTQANDGITVNDKREIFGWTMYDWANSAFSTTVGTVFLGPYVTSMAENAADASGFVYLLGMRIAFGSFFAFCISFSVGLQVLFLPVLGAIADYSNLRKRMLTIFAIGGSSATILMFFVTQPVWWLGGLLFIIANLCFGAAIVFYNAYLPDIASPDRRDAVSSQGFALGYLGGGLLLLANLVLFSSAESLGISAGLAIRINLASAGVWWLGFSFMAFRRLRSRRASRELPAGENYLSTGFKQLRETLSKMRQFPHTVRYLIAYLIYNDGIQTIIVMSAIFGSEELGLSLTVLSGVILMVQFVAFGGAFLFNWLANRLDTKRAISVSLVIWSAVTIYAFAFLQTELQFWVMGFVLALVLGGSQALSRSLFSQMIPAGQEAEFFSFYEVSDRGTSWLGPFVFGAVNQAFGSMRLAILSIIAFFVVGLIILLTVNVPRAIREAGNEVPAAFAAAD